MSEENMVTFSKYWGKKLATKNTVLDKAVLQKWRDKYFPEQTNTEKFITTRPALQEMLKGVL